MDGSASQASSPAWFRRHFNEDYLVLYSGRSQAQADREVDFLIRRLGIGADDHVLDVCCGFGRHLRAFRSRGVRATGIDLSPELLAVAHQEEAGDVACADMLHLPFATSGDDAGTFTVVVNLFTSFGYFETDEENAAAAREMARVLRPGGRFAVDLLNPEATLRDLEPLTDREQGDFRIREKRSYDRPRRRIEKSIRLESVSTGEVRQYFESVQVYREDEARRLLGAAGLEVEAVAGDFEGAPYSSEAPRMILTGRRGRP